MRNIYRNTSTQKQHHGLPYMDQKTYKPDQQYILYIGIQVQLESGIKNKLPAHGKNQRLLNEAGLP